MNNYFFPFGQKLIKVQQTETTPNKEVFVLGVYASAVHAKWLDKDNKIIVQALAVASEPEIFWRGEGVEDLITDIKIPVELGRLVPANKNLNGPSGVALDDLFLKPLGYSRQQAWLCDLLPESRVNPGQRKVLDKYYSSDIIQKYNLPLATIPEFEEDVLKDNAEKRQLEILNELEMSGAKTIILLGDLPIRWFLHFFDKRTKLSQFGNSQETYGQQHDVVINNKTYSVIPLCHPRNAARLGAFSKTWAKLHDVWVQHKLK
jgi:hypothetical protein